jgi:hypothetical protein
MAEDAGLQDTSPQRYEFHQERILTVSLYPEAWPHVPWIRLRGMWLQEAGFTPHSRVRVRVMKDCLIITKEPV